MLGILGSHLGIFPEQARLAIHPPRAQSAPSRGNFSAPQQAAPLPRAQAAFFRGKAPPSRCLFGARLCCSPTKSPPRFVSRGTKSKLLDPVAGAAVVAMSQPPRPRGASTAGLRRVGSGSPAGRPLPLGFEDVDARHGDGTEMGDDMSHDMSSRTYFTDLLGADVDESQDLLPTSQTPIDHGPAASKASQGRTKNFKDEEDKLLVSAWLNVGMDPIQGVDQPQGSFWARIHDYFYANKSFNSDRTQVSLMNRWSTIQHDVNMFCHCLTRIQDRNQSGCSVDDKIASTCALFKAEDKKNRNFALMHCWRILKDKPRWMDRRMQIGGTTTASNKKQKTKASSSPSSLVPVVSPATGGVDAAAQDASKRPDGKKTEKKKLRQRSTIEALDYLVAKMKEADAQKDLKKEERCNKAFALQEEKIKLEREKFEFQRDLEEERILTVDMSNMSYKLQQFYKRRQDEIFARRGGC